MIKLLTLLTVFAISACVPEGATTRQSSGRIATKTGDAEDVARDRGLTPETQGAAEEGETSPLETSQTDWDSVPEKNKMKEDNRSDETIICEDGLDIANAKDLEGNEFDALFGVICDGDETSEQYEQILRDAYKGEGDPKVMMVDSGTDDMYVTNMLFAYAIKVPLDTPSKFSEMKIFERLDGQGINHTDSKLTTEVVSREEFPGSGSVEEVNLQHRIQVARGASLYDVRNTQINNYLFVESTRDITLSTEHLIDDENEHYHVARGILVGVQSADDDDTYLVYVNEIVVKNRIDPKRLIETVTNLSKSSQQIIYEQTLTVE